MIFGSLFRSLIPSRKHGDRNIQLAAGEEEISQVVQNRHKIEENYRILRDEYGLKRSMECRLPVDAQGSPIPWITYPAIEFLKQFEWRNRKVFEYGAGNSSRFWNRLGARVWSVEHDPNWFGSLADDLNQTLYFCDNRDEYAQAIAKANQMYDLVVIDGVWREECAEIAPRFLNSGGMLVLDNADRDRDAAQILRNKGFAEIDFNGFGPINDYAWTTALFILAPQLDQSHFRPPSPIGGLASQPNSV